MTPPRRPLRPPFGPGRRRTPGTLPPAVVRELRREYEAPEEPRYWDALESRVLAAVRDGRYHASRAAQSTTGAFRVVPSMAAEWWHALARWAQPGLAAAAIALTIAGAVLLETRAAEASARAHSAFQDVLTGTGDPASAGPAASPSLEAGLARAGDDGSDDPAEAARRRRARIAAELLSGGLAQRHLPADELRLDEERDHPDDAHALDAHALDVRRDATLRAILPED